MSKFSLATLNQYVYPHFTTRDPDVVMGAVFGEDVALTRVHDGFLASHVDPIVGAVQNIGWLAVHVACNDIATSGAPPRWILTLVMVPHKEDEALLGQIMSDIGRAATETGVTIIGGHTGYSASLSRPLVAVTALGTLPEDKAICTRGARPGDHIFVTKGIALEGTAILAHDFAGVAKNLGLSDHDLEEARSLMEKVSIIPEAMVFSALGATAMHDVTRGGLMETLLELAALGNVALQVAGDRIPVPPVAARFAAAFQFDPLKMISSGTLTATVPAECVETVGMALQFKGIPFADIGLVVEGHGLHIAQNGQVSHFQDIHCEDDELARMWELYPRS